MTSKQLVRDHLRFRGSHRLPYDLPESYGSDIVWCVLNPDPDPLGNPDLAITRWTDEWGCMWERLGNTQLGEVKNKILESYDGLNSLSVPDVLRSDRWATVEERMRQSANKYLICQGVSLWTRINCLRGMEDSWTDIYEYPEGLRRLIDILVDMDRALISRYAALGGDCLAMADDWGLQSTLQINPQKWREIWKPCYRRVFEAAHEAGMQTMLHSCGYIVDILDDLIEVGLDMIHMDQQENMGLELLGKRFGGRITFFAPVDIQKTMCNGSPDDIRTYCRAMVKHLHHGNGGFIPRWYTDPVGAGHTPEALDAMCTEFLALSQQTYV